MLKHSMKISVTAAAAMLLAACGESNGYYDTNGVYHTYQPAANESTPTSKATTSNDPRPRDKAVVQEREQHMYKRVDGRVVKVNPPFSFVEPGYYGPNGYLLTEVPAGFVVPGHMLPPAGYCRIWFPARSAMEQPPVETCTGIKHRVPANAYIVYGG